MAERAGEIAAMKALQDLAGRMLKDGVAISKLAQNFANGMAPNRAIAAIHRHVWYAGVGSAECQEIAEAFEKGLPQQDLDKRLASRRANRKVKIEHNLYCGRELAPETEWTATKVVEHTRRRNEVIGVAIAAIEREGEAADEVLNRLHGYLVGGEMLAQLE